MRSVVKGYAWAVMAFLAIGIGAYAFALLAIPAIGAPFLAARFAAMPLAAYGHIAASAVAMILGAFQVNAMIRRRSLARHRWLGRVYVAAVLLGAPAGLALATVSEGGMVTHLAFGLLAVLWFATTAMAYRQIRQRNIVAHRQWMIRSYALTLAAVTLRLYIPAALVSGFSFEDAYPAISWLCWVPNLIVAEWIIRGTPQEARA